jgi:hypothetical protein
MSALRPPDDEPVRVAAPRAARAGRAPRRGVEDNSGAGLTGVAIFAIVVAALGFLGNFVGAPIAGAIVGVVVGVPASFIAMYARWGRPRGDL